MTIFVMDWLEVYTSDQSMIKFCVIIMDWLEVYTSDQSMIKFCLIIMDWLEVNIYFQPVQAYIS